MENLRILLISRPQGVYKWTIEDGLVVSLWGGENKEIYEPCSPREFLDRNNAEWHKNMGISEVCCAQVMLRLDNSEGSKKFKWIIEERIK